ncbi:MAG: SDR family oxidoreductase [Actinobacteria bacterium]|nr:SDR family oxidoreductase [Actinomycetota bacterium]
MGAESRLQGRKALVTGAGRGIGQACGNRLRAEGAAVMFADLDEDAARAGAAAVDGAAFGLDVTDPTAWATCVEACIESLGGLDLLVNAAGVLSVGSILDATLEEWRRVRAVNLDGSFHGCRASLQAMRDAGGGSIVNIASISGLRADPRTVAYDATKAGIRALTKEVAVYCARNGFGIRCNSVHPGSVDTAMMTGLASERPDVYGDWTAELPTGRQAGAEEIAAMVAFLASDDASFITGSEYVIDGGATL